MCDTFVIYLYKGGEDMFMIGDKIVYGSEGVYTVEQYSDSPVDKNDTRKFYILRPVHGPAGNIIFTPVDNENVKMRPVMSREEVLAFIDSIPLLPALFIEREKNRRDSYKAALASADIKQHIGIIKTVMERRVEYAKQKRRLSESDTDYENKAKFCVYGEFAIALDIPIDKVEKFIEERLGTVPV